MAPGLRDEGGAVRAACRRWEARRIAQKVAVIRQVPREDPWVRRAMTENGSCVFHALHPQLVYRGFQFSGRT